MALDITTVLNTGTFPADSATSAVGRGGVARRRCALTDFFPLAGFLLFNSEPKPNSGRRPLAQPCGVHALHVRRVGAAGARFRASIELSRPAVLIDTPDLLRSASHAPRRAFLYVVVRRRVAGRNRAWRIPHSSALCGGATGRGKFYSAHKIE